MQKTLDSNFEIGKGFQFQIYKRPKAIPFYLKYSLSLNQILINLQRLCQDLDWNLDRGEKDSEAFNLLK